MSRFVDLDGSVPTPPRCPSPPYRRSFSPNGLRRERSVERYENPPVEDGDSRDSVEG